MAVGTAPVRGVDRIDVAVKDAGAVVDLLRIGGIGRSQLGGDGELSGAQHALKAAGRCVAGQDRERITRDRFVVELHGRGPVFSCTTRSQDDRPCNRRSTGG